VNPRNLFWSCTLTREPDDSHTHFGKFGYLIFEIYPPTTLRRANTVPFKELELYARSKRERTSVMNVNHEGLIRRTINGFFLGGPVLKLDNAGGGGTSQLSVLIAKSRKASIADTCRVYR